jgi:hypothetical protein
MKEWFLILRMVNKWLGTVFDHMPIAERSFHLKPFVDHSVSFRSVKTTRSQKFLSGTACRLRNGMVKTV